MSKKNIIIAVIVVLVVLGVGFWSNKMNKSNDYSVVYMATKEVYVGKLTTFPDLQLTNGYILTTAPDATNPEKSNFQLTSMRDVLWSPKSIHLVKDNVVFYGPLMSNSKIAETIAAQKK